MVTRHSPTTSTDAGIAPLPYGTKVICRRAGSDEDRNRTEQFPCDDDEPAAIGQNATTTGRAAVRPNALLTGVLTIKKGFAVAISALFSYSLLAWALVLLLSVACDVGATAYLKVAGDRLTGMGFFGAAVLGVAVFAPSIVSFGYAMKIGPSYLATVGVWAVGVYTANAVVGVFAFSDPFSAKTAAGLLAAGFAVALLKP
jgi:hypothetical protein